MEDPVADLRQAISRLEFYWDRVPSPERTVKLSAIIGKMKQVEREIQEEIDRCTRDSQNYSLCTKASD